MVRYILRKVYNSFFFDMMILLGVAVTNLLPALIDFVAFKHKIVIMPDWPFFLAVFCTMYSVKAQTVPFRLGDSQTSL